MSVRDEGEPPRGARLPAAAPDDDAAEHASVLRARPYGEAAAPPDVRPRRPAPEGVRLGGLALLALVAAPALFGVAGLVVAVALMAACRCWDGRAKLVATLGVTLAVVVFSVVVAWLRATQVSQVESSSTRLAIARGALRDSFSSLPVTVGAVAAAYLAYVLVREALEDRRVD